MTRTARNAGAVWISTLVLLIAAASIIRHADDLSFWLDELWSVFAASHAPDLAWRNRELNWPPLYAALLTVWLHVAGRHDLMVHVLGVLIGLLGVAFAMRAGCAVGRSRRAGWLAGLAFGVSGYTVYFYLEARGYGLLLALAAAVVWLHVRWTRRPSWRRMVPLVIAQVLLLYTHFTGGVVLALLAIHMLIAVPRRVWPRWVPVVILTGVGFLPLAPQLVRSWRLRQDGLAGGAASHLLGDPDVMLDAYTMHAPWWGLALVVLAGVGWVAWLRHARSWQPVGAIAWLAAWGVGVPVWAYLTRDSIGLFSTRYLAYSVPGILLLVAVGLAYVPRRGWLAGAGLLLIGLAISWQPFDFRPRSSDSPPVRDLVRALADRVQAGDALVVDPNLDVSPYAWWYYEPLYLPGGISRAADGDEAGARVWYLVRQGSEDPAVRATVEAGRIPTEFWGPWYFIATLYEGPPLAPGVPVGDRIIYGGARLPEGTTRLPGDTITVETWWQVTEPPALDYSIGVHLLAPSGALVAQTDGGPMGPDTPGRTSAWVPGEVYRDVRTLGIPLCVPPGDYTLQVVVYQSWDGVTLTPEPGPLAASEDAIRLGTLHIESFTYCHRDG